MTGEIIFDFYYGNESEQYSFYRIPKTLITDDYFRKLSTDAKLLYGIMLDRMGLSMKNGWFDKEGRVFIYFTAENVMELLCCKSEKATKLFAELDTVKGIGLIERVRQGQGKPSKVYVKQFIKKVQPFSPENRKSRNLKIESQDTGLTNMQIFDNRKSSFSECEIQEFRFSKWNDTEDNNTDFNKSNLPINPSVSSDRRQIDAMDDYREMIYSNIEYEALCTQYDNQELDGIVELILDMICSARKTFRIGGEDLPAAIVKERFLKLGQFHIEYVLNSLHENTTEIRNIRNYLLTSLFNAPPTINHYYQAKVNNI